MFKRYFVPLFKVFGFILLFFIAWGIAASRLNLLLPEAYGKLAAEAAGLILGILLVLLYLKTDKKTFKDIGAVFRAGWVRELLTGSLFGAGAILGIILVLLAGGLAAVRGLEVSGAVPALSRFLAGMLRFLLLVAVAEELITRGYVYHYLRSKFTAAGAVLMTSFLFALMHALNPNATILALFNVFLAGVVLNLLVIRDSSLLSAIGFHFGWNFLMGTVFSSPVSGGAGRGIIKLSLKGHELLSGGSFGLEGGLICTLALLLILGYQIRHTRVESTLRGGLERRKNQVFAGFLAAAALIYVFTEIMTWTPTGITSDGSAPSQIGRYPDTHDYQLELRLDTGEKTLEGMQNVSFINNTGDVLKEAYFHIYPNAFGEYGGSIDIKSVRTAGKAADFRIEGEDRTLLAVPLEASLQPGGRQNIEMEYVIRIPQKGNKGFGDRFGYGDNTYNLGNFFPIAAVYENGEWDKHPYDDKGDAFYSETSNFDVTIAAPEMQVIAASGVILGREQAGPDRVWQIRANAVRDFAFVASDMFRVEEVMVEGTLVRSYAGSRVKAKKIAEIGADAIRIFNEKYGKYPYPTCSIVQSDIGGGMEYPNLVMIESNDYGNTSFANYGAALFFGKPKGSLEFVTVHELGHQWWYGLVGNDEYREAWIDEPLTQFATLAYYEEKYGREAFDRLYGNYIELSAKVFLMEEQNAGASMARSLNEFDEDEYYVLIYHKGTMMFKDLRDQLGEETFDRFLRTLYDRHKFKIVKGEELIRLTSEIAGKDMSGFYSQWLNK